MTGKVQQGRARPKWFNFHNRSQRNFMRSLYRISFVAATFALLLALASVSSANAQTIPVAEAQTFLGSWVLALEAQGQAVAMDLNITDDAGNVAAEVVSPMGAQKISKIARNEAKLLLSATMDLQGQAIPISILLTPTDAGVDVEMNVAEGMFVAQGKGTKK